MDEPLRVAILCSGLDHVRRGYESFSLEVVAALAGEASLDVSLVKGSGPSGPHEHRAHVLRRDPRRCPRPGEARCVADRVCDEWRSPRARGIGREQLSRLALTGRLPVDPYEIEELNFAVTASLATRDADVLLVSDVLTCRAMAALRRLTRREVRLVLSNGAPVSPPYPYADFVQHLTTPAHERAIAAGEAPERQRMVPYGFTLPRPTSWPDANATTIRASLGLPEAPIVLSVGALNQHHKRHDHLVREVAKLRGPRPHVVLLGSEEFETESLRALAVNLLGANNVTLRSVASNEVAQYLPRRHGVRTGISARGTSSGVRRSSGIRHSDDRARFRRQSVGARRRRNAH